MDFEQFVSQEKDFTLFSENILHHVKFKAWVCGSSLAGTVGSNPADGIDTVSW
jgi:hypothetical protein